MTWQDDFDWNSDPSVHIAHQPPTAVFVNRDGGVTIRQQGDTFDEDQFVIVRPEHALTLAELILHEAGIDATISVTPSDERLLLPKPDQREHRSVLTGETLPLPLSSGAAP